MSYDFVCGEAKFTVFIVVPTIVSAAAHIIRIRSTGYANI